MAGDLNADSGSASIMNAVTSAAFPTRTATAAAMMPIADVTRS